MDLGELIMAKKNLVFIIEAHQGYLRKSETNCSDENFREQNDILFSAISNTYIPLLDMLERLKKDSLNFKIGLVISAPLCTLLEDPQVQLQRLLCTPEYTFNILYCSDRNACRMYFLLLLLC